MSNRKFLDHNLKAFAETFTLCKKFCGPKCKLCWIDEFKELEKEIRSKIVKNPYPNESREFWIVQARNTAFKQILGDE